MFYIQTYKKDEDKKENSLKNFLSGDYMGSAEFEFGSVQKSYSHIAKNSDIKLSKVQVQSKGGKEALVDFFVLADNEGLKHFEEDIPKHMDETSVGAKTKERTNLWEKFNSDGDKKYMPDFWFSVDRFVHSSETKPVIAFSDSKVLVVKFLLYFIKTKNPHEDIAVFKMFDEVYCAESWKGNNCQSFKVVGINEDGSFTIKNHGNKLRVYSNFIYTKDFIEKHDLFNKLSMV